MNTRPLGQVLKHLRRDPVSQFILPHGQLAPRRASCPGISCPPRAHPDYLHPRGQAVQAGLSCPPAQHK